MIPRPVVSPTVTGTVICKPAEALTFERATVTGGVPVAVAVAVMVFVGVPLGIDVGVFVAVFVAVEVGVPDGDAPPLTVTLPLPANAGGSPSFHTNPGWKIWPGSV